MIEIPGLTGGMGCLIACGVVLLLVIFLFWSDGRSAEKRQKEFFLKM